MIKSTILGVTTILSMIIVIGFGLHYFLPQKFTLLQAMLLGAMVGGTSTLSILRILSGLGKLVENIEGTRLLLTMESIISDPICIISSITLIKMIMLPHPTLSGVLKDIFSVLTLASLWGLLIGIFWARILDRLRGSSLTYIMTLAILLPTYLAVESFIGGGGRHGFPMLRSGDKQLQVYRQQTWYKP